jgi:uncharacterized protein
MMEDNGLDEDGYIRSDGSFSKITGRFRALLEIVQEKIVNAFESQLHSLYVYGSVASGTARPATSDLDILMVFKNEPTQQMRASVKELEHELSQSFRADLREVGLAVTFLAEVLQGDYQIGIKCFIKHLCICLYGADLGAEFPKFKPTRAVAYGLNGDIRDVIEKAKHAMLDGSPETISKTTMSISRNMIRAAFCLVMEEANCWTTNLNDCCSVFTTYYPEQANQVQHLLQISKGAQVSYDELLSILNDFGRWLCDEVERKLRTAEN